MVTAANFDYIIIGAGSSGCVMANRLSANPDVSVLLLEAGGADKNPFIHMPAAITRVKNNPKTDWCYKTVPQTSLADRQIPIPRGKALGGSSSINAMIYMRGQSQDYDEWLGLGNVGWGFDDVLPYFIKSENNKGSGLDIGFHGDSGPLNVCDRTYTHPLSDYLVEAAIEAGLPTNHDFNGRTQSGVGRYQVTQIDNKRCSAAVAYLNPVKSRKNLSVITNALVLKIEVTGGKATGVNYAVGKHIRKAASNNEIIVSAGAIESPKLLMLSGIGPEDELGKHSIKVIHSLPGVGKNLQDHLNISVLAKTNAPISLAGIGTGIGALKAGLQYLWDKSGPGSSNGAEAGGFFTTHLSPGRPDIQLHFLPLMLGENTQDTGIHGVTIHACNLRPSDTGELTLSSADATAPPLIDNRFLETDGNIEVMREGIAISREILAAKPVAEMLSGEFAPGISKISVSELDKFIRATSETEFHPVGTCKMGNDPLAVVDNQLRVHGVQNLRVVDASIMPKLISGNTNAPCMMIGEKAADLILNN